MIYGQSQRGYGDTRSGGVSHGLEGIRLTACRDVQGGRVYIRDPLPVHGMLSVAKQVV